MLEIVTPEWRYTQGDQCDFENILQVKEQRRLGTSRWGTCTPQAPAIVVRVSKHCLAASTGKGELCVKADLWSFGPSYKGKNILNRQEPDATGSPFSKLRANTYITCTENVEKFVDEKDDGYLYATLKSFVTRGARVYCRKNHVALRLSVIEKVRGSVLELESIPPVRTARLSISEKAMCPRESDRKRKSPSKASSLIQTSKNTINKRPKLDAEPEKVSSTSVGAPQVAEKNAPFAQSLMPPSLLPFLIQPDLFMTPSQSMTQIHPTKRSASQKLVDNLLNHTQGVLSLSDPRVLKALAQSQGTMGMSLLYPPSSLFS